MAAPRAARLIGAALVLGAAAAGSVVGTGPAAAGSVQVSNTAVNGVVVHVPGESAHRVEAAADGTVTFPGAAARLRVTGENDAECAAFVSDGGSLTVFGSADGGISCSAE